MSRHTLVVMTNAADGKDAEFNAWYTDVHLPEVLEVEGFQSAQRFKVADATFAGDSQYAYLALYEIETDDLQSALNALKDAAKNMNMSATLDRSVGAWAFTPITERVEAKTAPA